MKLLYDDGGGWKGCAMCLYVYLLVCVHVFQWAVWERENVNNMGGNDTFECILYNIYVLHNTHRANSDVGIQWQRSKRKHASAYINTPTIHYGGIAKWLSCVLGHNIHRNAIHLEIWSHVISVCAFFSLFASIHVFCTSIGCVVHDQRLRQSDIRTKNGTNHVNNEMKKKKMYSFIEDTFVCDQEKNTICTRLT